MNETIQKILSVAVHAPSGENAQPWRFVVQGNRISVFNIPERDQSLYNVNQLGSYVAHGTLIENIIITSTAHGYGAKTQVFPDGQNKDLVAIIDLQKESIAVDPLHAYIEKRCTNRKPYKKNMPLSAEQVSELARAQEVVAGGKAVFVQEEEKIKALAHAGSMNERVMFDNQFLHNFFFTHITWTKEEDEEKRVGFYIKTLEMPAPAQVAMKLFRSWPIMRFLNKFGAAKAIAQTNTGVYASSSAIGAVIMPKDGPNHFIDAGRVMQRIWLTATKLGLSIQPLTGVLFFTHGINTGKTDKFMPHHLELIKNAHADIYRTLEAGDGEMVAMMFRIGHGGEPTARAIKMPPEIQWSNF